MDAAIYSTDNTDIIKQKLLKSLRNADTREFEMILSQNENWRLYGYAISTYNSYLDF